MGTFDIMGETPLTMTFSQWLEHGPKYSIYVCDDERIWTKHKDGTITVIPPTEPPSKDKRGRGTLKLI